MSWQRVSCQRVSEWRFLNGEYVIAPVHRIDGESRWSYSHKYRYPIAKRFVLPLCRRRAYTTSIMSLQALPTEMDEQILGHLAPSDLSTMSKVSKYHRKIAEPLLYRTITLWDDRSINIRSLLLTLLSRRDLALHIRRLLVRLDLRSSRNLPLTSEVDNRMEEALPAIQDSIKTIIGTGAGTARIRTTWLGSVLSEDFVGGTSALVVCMALNIKVVTFISTTSTGHFDGCSTFSKMLSEAASSTSSQHSGRLSKLTTLGLHNRTSIYMPNLPSLQDLRVLSSQHIVFPQQHQDSTLKKVDSLLWINTSTLPSLAAFIHQNGLPHLQSLFILGRRAAPADGLQAVIDGLSVGCTELTSVALDADFSAHQNDIPPLSRLTSLRNVHTLAIDLRFLLPRSNQDQLLSSGALLPPRLTNLRIRGVAYADIGRLMLENNSQDPLALRSFFPYGPSLKEFFFYVRSKDGQSAGYDTLLASIAKMLRARGVDFKVYRYPVAANNEREPQLLITHSGPVAEQA